MDAKTEGYLVAAIALIPTGTAMLMTATEFKGQIIGLGVTALGLLAVYLRGQQKDIVPPPAGKVK